MIELLLLLSGWQYGGLVRDLGHPEYAVRNAAHRRLADAGWAAALSLRCTQPALFPPPRSGAGFPHTHSQISDGLPARYSYPEQSLRIEILQRKLSLPFDATLRKLLLTYPLEEPIDPVLADYLWSLRQPLCDWIQQRKLFWYSPPLQWVSLKPFRSGSELGDYFVVLREARRVLLHRSGESE
jgi:hypothetical protein